MSSYISYFPWFKKKRLSRGQEQKTHQTMRKIKNKILFVFSLIRVCTCICLYICVEAKSGDVKRERWQSFGEP